MLEVCYDISKEMNSCLILFLQSQIIEINIITVYLHDKTLLNVTWLKIE